jgi:UDP-N-acetyl-2-amino-2-deoxyglucuronate dehydrogenase
MGRIGVGLVGAGAIAGAHAAAYAAFKDRCEIVAFADLVEDKAAARAREFGAKAAYKSPDELLKRKDISLVSICTPPFEHAANAIAAAAAGKHVLCEKPLAPSPEECDRMIAAAAKAGTVLAGVFQYRFDPAVVRAKALLDSGAMGPARLALLSGLWWRGPNYYDLWWRGTWEREGGGALLNHHCHLVDVLLHLLGEPEAVSAELGALTHPDIEVEDTAVLSVRFRSGALAAIAATVSAPQNHAVLEVGAAKAGLTIRVGQPLEIACRKPDPGGFPLDDPEAKASLEAAAAAVPVPARQGHGAVVDDVLRALEARRPPAVPGEEARRAVEFTVAAYKAGTEGVRVTMPLAAGDPFRTRAGLLARAWRGGVKPRREAPPA